MPKHQYDGRTAKKIASLSSLAEIEGYRVGVEFRGGMGAEERAHVDRREQEIIKANQRKKGKVST